MNWIDKEKGPECFCGMPTVISVTPDEKEVHLLCIFHSDASGAMFPLPVNGRPEHWPNMTHDEMKSLIDQGFAEQDGKED